MEKSSRAAKTNTTQPSRRRTIVVVLAIFVVVLVAITAQQWMKPEASEPTNTSPGIQFTQPTELCEPEDVQQCPDGTFIHRELPNCELPACPNSNN